MIAAQGKATAELDEPVLAPKVHLEGLDVGQMLARELSAN
jgi:hypothetical protein